MSQRTCSKQTDLFLFLNGVSILVLHHGISFRVQFGEETEESERKELGGEMMRGVPLMSLLFTLKCL